MHSRCTRIALKLLVAERASIRRKDSISESSELRNSRYRRYTCDCSAFQRKFLTIDHVSNARHSKFRTNCIYWGWSNFCDWHEWLKVILAQRIVEQIEELKNCPRGSCSLMRCSFSAFKNVFTSAIIEMNFLTKEAKSWIARTNEKMWKQLQFLYKEYFNRFLFFKISLHARHWKIRKIIKLKL